MVYSFEVTLFLYIFAAAVFWVFRTFSFKAALIWMALFNVVFLATANLLLFCYLVLQLLLVAGLYVYIVKVRKIRGGIWPWFTFIGLIPFNIALHAPNFITDMPLFAGIENYTASRVFWTVGSTFFVIKSFIILKESVRDQKFHFLTGLVALTFIPSLPAGPIYGAGVWSKAKIADTLKWKDYAFIVGAIGWGAAMFFVLSVFFKGLMDSQENVVLNQIANVYISLISLYFDFAGYTLVALGIGRLFGARLPRNFNRPYLATSIQNFWQRWHMSLSAFIGTYLFKPFVRQTGSQRWGIFLAFVCAGLWHEFSIAYLAWGVGHGFALSLNKKPPALWDKAMDAMPMPVSRAISWFLTITWVALLSYTATFLINF